MTDRMIQVVGAYQNNLKNISVSIPKYEWTTVTGVSGSGKSTLVYDVIYAQAEKDFLGTLSTYARRSLPRIGDIGVQKISGLSPCIVIDQAGFHNTPRSTVGTFTEIYDYLRLLFSRAGDSELSAGDFSFNNAQAACEECGGLGETQAPNIPKLLDMERSLNEGAILHKTWKVNSRYWNIIRAIGYFDMNKKLKDFTSDEMDKLLYSEPFSYQNDEPGHIQTFSYEGIVRRMKKRMSDSRGLPAAEYDSQFFRKGRCPKCGGARLNRKALGVKLKNGLTISDCVNLEVQDLYAALKNLHGPIEDALLPDLLKKIEGLLKVGMGYMTLNRGIHTLSGGEAQKVKLAKAMGCALSDMLYILDEPTAGMHPKDVSQMVSIIRDIKDRGNTVLVIEHNREIIAASDRIIDMGPAGGKDGGKVLYNGPVEKIYECGESKTASYLKESTVKIKKSVRKPAGWIRLSGVTDHNIRDLSVSIPQGVFVCITGVSGAGKSTLLNALIGAVQDAVVVDQWDVGANNRANAATYTRAFDFIRQYYSAHTGRPESDFSFNSDGCCEVCKGLGYLTTDMHFLGDVRIPCETCNGKRYKKEILQCNVKGKNISDVLDMTVSEACGFFAGETIIVKKLKDLERVGLDYITLGQPLSTFSGGELQRLKLADKLHSKGEFYAFDEPTRGLHFCDVERLTAVMNYLVEEGNTVVAVEHNMQVVSQADWIIDMGPQGGKDGGKVLFSGIPEQIFQCDNSYTKRYLERN